MASRDELIAAAEEWMDGDPDEETRTELARLVEVGDPAALEDRLGQRLQFGTAGLRGEVGAGPNRMNRAVVIQATRGLAEHVLKLGASGPVVVGFDARLSSRGFMEDVVGVLAAAGLQVRYFDVPTPTPLVAFAQLRLDAAAAVVVTASHNPPQDNGYKVYSANGAQIVPPEDELIAAEIGAVGPAALVPRIRWASAVDSDLCQALDHDSVFSAYQAAVARPRPERDAAPLRIVYTPLHGVGGRFVKELLEGAGHDVVPVLSQFHPDGHFPTVSFPNPEEPGALDEALAIAARDTTVDLIVANDPDADRLAVTVPGAGGAVALTGNQVGVLLADWCLDGSAGAPLVINSVVSSPMLAGLANARGARHAVTLTGFKWIWNAALDLTADGFEFVMGYEEALGYSLGQAVRDKDGISAAFVFADLAAHEKTLGRTVLDRLCDLYREIGLWASAQHSVQFSDSIGPEGVGQLLDGVVASPPTELAGVPVTAVVDFRQGAASRPRYLPASPLVEIDLGAAGRCLIRPSGTEPKLKIYVDLAEPAASGTTAEVLAAERELTARAGAVAAAAAVAMGLGEPA